MNILFYLQPQTIRNDPGAFSWIFLKYLGFSQDLAKHAEVRFLVNDALNTEQNVFSPKTFGVKLPPKNTVEGWKEILLNEAIPEKLELLEKVYSCYKFDLVVCWNFDATLHTFCKDRGITTLYQELGLLRNPMLYQQDSEGLLWKSSLPKLYAEKRTSLGEEASTVSRYKQNLLYGIKKSREDICKEYGLDSNKPLVYLPLQLEDDSNVIGNDGVTFQKMDDLCKWCCSAVPSDRYNLLARRHPGNTDIPISAPIKFAQKISSLDMINACDYVITISSTSGFEGLMLDKKVICLGYTPYRIPGIVYTERFESLGDTDEFFARLQRNEVTRFLEFALTEYHLTEQQFKDPASYINFCTIR